MLRARVCAARVHHTQHQMAMKPPPREAYATMWYGSSKLVSFNGLRALLHSIRRQDPRRFIVVLNPIGPEHEPLDVQTRKLLKHTYGALLWPVPTLRSRDPMCLGSLGVRSESLGIGFSFFHVFNLTSYDRVVWLEADQLVLQPLTELWQALDRPTAFSTARSKPRVAATKTLIGALNDCRRGRKSSKYNSGVLLLEPSAKIFRFFTTALAGGRQNYTCTDGYQTLWNKVLYGRIQCIHRTFNCIGQSDLRHSVPAAARRCLEHNSSLPHVAHFAGHLNKPWQSGGTANPNQGWAYKAWHDTIADAIRMEQQGRTFNPISEPPIMVV